MNLQMAHLIGCIQTLLSHDERLIYFFFHHKKAELRLGSTELLAEARLLSRGEYILIQAALDFWNGQGGLRLGDALAALDDENILALVKAILAFREIEFPGDTQC